MLKYKADRKTLGMVLLYFIATYFVCWYFYEFWLIRTSIIMILSLLSFFYIFSTYNTIYQPVFKSKWLNRAYQIVLSFICRHSVSDFASSYNFNYHQQTQLDIDRMRTSQMRFHWNFLNQLLFFFRFMLGIMKNESLFVKKILREKPKWFVQYALKLTLVLGAKFYCPSL